MSTTIVYSYDKSHRLTTQLNDSTEEQHTFSYNQRDMVTQIVDTGGTDATRTFTYNGLGERVYGVDGTSTPSYWCYDGMTLVYERQGANTWNYRHSPPVPGSAAMLNELRTNDGTTASPDFGGDGSMKHLKDVSAGQTDSYEASAFGQRISAVDLLGNRLQTFTPLALVRQKTASQELFVAPFGAFLPNPARFLLNPAWLESGAIGRAPGVLLPRDAHQARAGTRLSRHRTAPDARLGVEQLASCGGAFALERGQIGFLLVQGCAGDTCSDTRITDWTFDVLDYRATDRQKADVTDLWPMDLNWAELKARRKVREEELNLKRQFDGGGCENPTCVCEPWGDDPIVDGYGLGTFFKFKFTFSNDNVFHGSDTYIVEVMVWFKTLPGDCVGGDGGAWV